MICKIFLMNERNACCGMRLGTPQTLVSIDTSQTLLRHVQTHSDTQNWRFRQVRCVGRVYRVSIVSNSDTLTLLTRPTRLATHVSPHKSPRMPTAKLGMQPMGLLGGSNPWPWPFGTTTPSTSAVGRHPDTSDTSDTQTLDTQTRSDTTHASQLSRALRHRLDTGQTPLTLLTPVSIDTAQTRLRHCSDTPDTSETQTQQGSILFVSMAGRSLLCSRRLRSREGGWMSQGLALTRWATLNVRSVSP